MGKAIKAFIGQATMCGLLLMAICHYAIAQQNPAVIADIKKPPTGTDSYGDREQVETVEVYFSRERRWDRGWKNLPLNFLDEINIRRPGQPKVYKLIVNFNDPRRKQLILAEGNRVRIVDPETIQVEGGFFGWIVGRIRTTTRYIQAIASGTQYGILIDGERTRLFVWEGAVEVSSASGKVTVAEKQLTEAIGAGPPSQPRVPRFDEIKDLVLFGLEVDPDVRIRIRDERSQLQLHQDVIRAEFENAARPGDVGPLVSLGNLNLLLGRYDQALDVFNRAEAISPRSGDIYNGRGIVFTMRRGTGNALAEFTTALRRDDTSRFRNNLGVYYLVENQVTKAIEELNQAIRLDRYNDIAYNALGVAWLQSSPPGANLIEAETALRRSVQIKEHPVALNNLGTVSMLQGKTQEAERHYQRAATLDPADAAVANNLGVSHLKQARYDLAVDQFLGAIQSAASDPTAYCNLGLIYLARPELRDSIRARVQALSFSGIGESSSIKQVFLGFLDELGNLRPEQFEESCKKFKAAFAPGRSSG